MPDLSEEEILRRDLALPADAPIAGVDEAGRGPCAGPVVAAAAILPPTGLPADLAALIDDSKKLSAKRRAYLFEALTTPGTLLAFAVAEASVEEIDRINILQAAMLAMRRAVDALPVPPAAALIDGNRDPGPSVPSRPLVKGDSRSLSVAAASILAKVTRDGLMADLALAHPGYGWETNQGYGSKAHLAALRVQGVTIHHRRSFAPVRAALDIES
ncbi:ribonuclease HII [Marivibrio halodurans]|uniref:Ribonuclease HII n=1 Tax=Marivibrio halodurans TaxID=2039722 RepID=A0A8J7SN52_9PROT|nr:ribonuclease HII [Marivibrio halodurans]MBP5857808.1 ribonuclease HII [Marivibrio halodurans]